MFNSALCDVIQLSRRHAAIQPCVVLNPSLIHKLKHMFVTNASCQQFVCNMLMTISGEVLYNLPLEQSRAIVKTAESTRKRKLSNRDSEDELQTRKRRKYSHADDKATQKELTGVESPEHRQDVLCHAVWKLHTLPTTQWL